MTQKNESGRKRRNSIIDMVIATCIATGIITFFAAPKDSFLLNIIFLVVKGYTILLLIKEFVINAYKFIKLTRDEKREKKKKVNERKKIFVRFGGITFILLSVLLVANVLMGIKKYSGLTVSEVKEQVGERFAEFIGADKNEEVGKVSVDQDTQNTQDNKGKESASTDDVLNRDEKIVDSATFYLPFLEKTDLNKIIESQGEIKCDAFFLEKAGDSLPGLDYSYGSVVEQYEEMRKNRKRDGIDGSFPEEEETINNLQAKQERFFRDCDSSEQYHSITTDREDWEKNLVKGDILVEVIEDRTKISKECRNGDFYCQDSNAYQKLGEEYIRQNQDGEKVLYYMGQAINEKMKAISYEDISEEEYYVILLQIKSCYFQLANYVRLDQITRYNADVMYNIIEIYVSENEQNK